MDYLLWKNANFSFSYIHVSIVWKGLFSNEKVTKYSFSVYFDWNEKLKNVHIFHQNHNFISIALLSYVQGAWTID